MRMWLVRAGRGSEATDEFLASGAVAIGEGEPGVYRFGPVDRSISRGELLALYAVKHPEMPPGAHATWATEFMRLISEMEVGDVVITPDQRHDRYLRGTVIGSSTFIARMTNEKSDLPHAGGRTRPQVGDESGHSYESTRGAA